MENSPCMQAEAAVHRTFRSLTAQCWHPHLNRMSLEVPLFPIHSSPLHKLALAMAALLVATASFGRDQEGHERARQAVQAGEVLPLRTVLERLEQDHPGQVLEVELEQAAGRWIYEIKLLQAGGQLVKLKLDAQTAAVLSRKTGAENQGDAPDTPHKHR